MKKIKCVVWDLDNTIWDGIISENDNVKLKSKVKNVIIELDKRGILQAISSKNNEVDCLNKLKEFEIDEYFIVNEINWNPKSSSIKKIRQVLNIGMDTLAFIDDQPFEREEVIYELPEVRVYNISEVDKILNYDEFIPEFITEDTARRRIMYQTDIRRNEEDIKFEGTSEQFLKSLEMKLSIKKASKEDLDRIQELTVRTNQLNTTGYTYTHKELLSILEDNQYEIMIAELEDKFGSYGKIGISLVKKTSEHHIIKLFLLSCRVMSKGIGNVYLKYLINHALEEDKKIAAEFIETDRNRMMYITYRFLGFEDKKIEDNKKLLEYRHKKQLINGDYLELLT